MNSEIKTLFAPEKARMTPVIKIKRAAYARFIYLMFPIGYAIFGALAYRCLLIYIAPRGIFYESGGHPRLLAFSAAAGLFSLAVCAALAAGNALILFYSAEKNKTSRLFGEILITLSLCPTFILFWDRVFLYL